MSRVRPGCGRVEEKLFEVAAYAARIGMYEKVEDALREGYSVVGDYLVMFDPGEGVLCVEERGGDGKGGRDVVSAVVAAWGRKHK